MLLYRYGSGSGESLKKRVSLNNGEPGVNWSSERSILSTTDVLVTCFGDKARSCGSTSNPCSTHGFEAIAGVAIAAFDHWTAASKAASGFGRDDGNCWTDSNLQSFPDAESWEAAGSRPNPWLLCSITESR